MISKEAKRLYDIKYRAKNKERLKEVRRAWAMENKDKLHANAKKYSQSEKAKETRRVWKDNNRDKIRAWKLKWATSDNGRASAKRWRDKSPKAMFRLYVASAKKRNLPFDISEELFTELINRDCHYCGQPAIPKRNGLDRIDNDQGYNESNVIPCCFVCNQMKGKRTVNEFLAHVMRIIEHAIEEE